MEEKYNFNAIDKDTYYSDPGTELTLTWIGIGIRVREKLDTWLAYPFALSRLLPRLY